MKKLLLIFLIIFSSQSFAEWDFVVAFDEEIGIYVDFDNIKENDGYIFFWQLTNYLKPQEIPYGEGKGQSFQSYIIYKQADCNMFREKSIQSIVYPQIFGKGNPIMTFENKNKWFYPPPTSTSDVVLKRVCE